MRATGKREEKEKLAIFESLAAAIDGFPLPEKKKKSKRTSRTRNTVNTSSFPERLSREIDYQNYSVDS
jgi:hypothetical protein